MSNSNNLPLVPLSQIAANEKGAIRRGPFGGSIKKEYFVPSGYKVYEQKNAIASDFEIGSYFIDENKYKELKGFSIKSQDLIISCAGTIGKIAIIPDDAKPGVINQALMRIRPDQDIIVPQYLKYYLESPVAKREIFGQVAGTALKNLAAISEIKKSKIPLPSLDEQKRIVAILDKADAIRRKRKEAIALTEELLRSTFLDMFGEPVGRKQAWKQHNLSELVTIVSGQVDPKIEPYIDMPHIGGTNIESNTGFIHEVQTPRELNLISGKYLFEPTDILLSKIRPYLNKVAIPGFSGVCSADIYPLRINEKIVDRNYLLYLLRSSEFLNYAEKHSARTNIPKINRSALLKFCSKLPPIELQRQFSQIFTNIYNIKRSCDLSMNESTNCFNSLLQKAFRGEL